MFLKLVCLWLTRESRTPNLAHSVNIHISYISAHYQTKNYNGSIWWNPEIWNQNGKIVFWTLLYTCRPFHIPSKSRPNWGKQMNIRPLVTVSKMTWCNRYIYHRNFQFLNNVIINKTKVFLPQAYVTIAIIIWLSNLSILSVPDESYSRNVLCTLNLISTFLQFSLIYRI